MRRTPAALRWDHASLAVDDVDAAIAFFETGLGFRLTFLERGMSDQIASMLGVPGAQCDLAQLETPSGGPRLEVIRFRLPASASEDPPAAPVRLGMGHAAFRVRGFDATLTRLVGLGARPVGSVTQFSDGRSVYLALPFGAFLELEEDASTEPEGEG